MVNHGDPSVYHPVWESIRARQYISLASLALLLWEHVLTFSHEYTHVWKSRLTVTKWLYLLLRYFSIICQLTNHIISSSLLFKAPLSKSTCFAWVAFQASYFQVVQMLFELILLVRVWALYNKGPRVGFFLLSMYLCGFVILVYANVRVNMVLQLDGTCLVMKTPPEAYILAIYPLVTQAVIWTMTWYKKVRSFGDGSWYGMGGPIATLMFRDGLLAFMFITAIFPVLLSYSVYVHDLTNSVWTILVTVLSIGGCRIIMNMQRLKIPRELSEVELTTFVVTWGADSGVKSSPPQFYEDDEDDYAESRLEFPM